MKRSLIPIILLMMAATGLAAITQSGYVKTRGRLGSNGQVIPGKRIESATVELQNGSSVVSNKSGNFNLSLPANKFYLKNVKKSGYVVSDPDMLSKQYAYSPNPLILVLDEPTVQTDEKLATERKLRRNLQKQLQQREDELEALKEENKITQDQYREALQKLYSNQKNNEKFIAEMAERYSKIDFDQLDDFQARVAAFIKNGELSRADSLLKTKGSMDERAAEIEEILIANAEEEAELAERIKKLDESKKAAEIMISDYCTDCYNHFEICKMRFDNDSAAYWLARRIACDSSKLDYQLEAGAFVRDYLADYPLALKYFEKCLDLAIEQYGPDNEYLVKVFRNIGYTYCNQAEFERALDNFFKAEKILEKKSGDDNLKLFQIYNDLGYVYSMADDYYHAFDYFFRATLLKLGNAEDVDPDMASLYNNSGLYEIAIENFDGALEFFEKSLKIRLEIFGENHPDVAISFNNIGVVYSSQKKFELALEYYKKALKIQLEILGENHPDVATSYSNMGDAYFYLGKLAEALDNHEKALEIRLKIFGEIHPYVEYNYEDLAYICWAAPDYREKSLNYRLKASFIHRKLLYKINYLLYKRRRAI